MQIFTIGHSTRSIDEFTSMLSAFHIDLLVDVRSYPGSRKFPHFNKEVLPKELEPFGIQYTHQILLGGRRNKSKTVPEHVNAGFRNASFKNYADYMQTMYFEAGIMELIEMAKLYPRICYMCSEAVWWKCHRRCISDALVARGVEVLHIMSQTELTPHVLADFAVCNGHNVTYPGKSTKK